MSDYCRDCGRRDVFCGCPMPISEVIAIVGIACVGLALLIAAAVQPYLV